MFGEVSKITLFEAKLLIKVGLVLRAESTETPNQTLRPLPDLFRHHESIGGIRIFKRVAIKKIIFLGKSCCTVLHAIFCFYAFGPLFWKSSTLQTCFDE